MRLFGGERINSIMERMNLDEDTPIENKMLTRAIEQAQTTVESRNFQSRKSVLEYDDVMNKQREIIYDQRKQVLEGMDVKGIIMNMMSTAIGHQVSSAFGGESHMDEAGMRELLRQVEGLYFPRYTVLRAGAHPSADGGGGHRRLYRRRCRLLRKEGAGVHLPCHA